jgi:tetratricopeptide (TPR) repeat protein
MNRAPAAIPRGKNPEVSSYDLPSCPEPAYYTTESAAVPVKTFLSHASADKPFVEELKRFLEEGGDIKCWLDTFEIEFGGNIAARIGEGLGKSDFVLVFLSPAAQKSRWVEEEWTTAYFAQVNSGVTRLIPVLLGDAQLPALLEGKKYCDLRTNQLEGMRELKAALLRSRTTPAPGGYSGASLPNFVGREAEIGQLKELLSQPGSLVPIVGMPGLGKTYLAREFIRRHGAQFDSVYQLDCEKKDLAALTGDLASQLGLRLDGDAVQVAAQLRRYLSPKRCLLFLDNVDDDQPGALAPEGRAAVLLTSRHKNIPFFADYPALSPEFFSDREALDLFRRVVGAFEKGTAMQLFRRLGHLPIAIAVAAGLIRNDVHYTVESLLAELPPLDTLSHGRNNVGQVLRSAIGALSERQRDLLTAMAACAPGGVRLGFAAELAGFGEADSLDALQELFRRSLVVELDRFSRRYRLHTLIREAARPSVEMRQYHARLVFDHLVGWEKAPVEAAELIEEAEQAGSALASDSKLGWQIAIEAGNLSRALGRLAEANEFYARAQDTGRRAAREDWLSQGLAGQALILWAWGKLDEAMALHKREEAICLELGDRASLQVSYGNQALILTAWGKLDEALALIRKREAICLELGNRVDLGKCYWSWRLLAKAQNDPKTSQEKLAQALSIFTELKMPRERDAVLKAMNS